MSDDTDRLIREIIAAAADEPWYPATGVPRSCNVDVDNEVMRMVYDKIGEAAPIYPPSWADFWSGLRGRK